MKFSKTAILVLVLSLARFSFGDEHLIGEGKMPNSGGRSAEGRYLIPPPNDDPKLLVSEASIESVTINKPFTISPRTDRAYFVLGKQRSASQVNVEQASDDYGFYEYCVIEMGHTAGDIGETIDPKSLPKTLSATYQPAHIAVEGGKQHFRPAGIAIQGAKNIQYLYCVPILGKNHPVTFAFYQEYFGDFLTFNLGAKPIEP